MTKYLLIAIVLLSLAIAKSLDAEASQTTLTQERIVDFNERPESRVREKRFLSNPLTKIANLWNTLGQMYQLYVEVSWSTFFFVWSSLKDLWTFYKCNLCVLFLWQWLLLLFFSLFLFSSLRSFFLNFASCCAFSKRPIPKISSFKRMI